MLYCTKCRCVCQDSLAKCPNCKNPRLRAADEEDMVRLHRADQYTAQQLEAHFEAAGIRWETAPVHISGSEYLYSSDVMPTDREIFVRLGDLPEAQKISARMKDELDRSPETAEEFEDMPPKKRMVVQVLSVIAFLVLVVLTVFGADALANWLKSLF